MLRVIKHEILRFLKTWIIMIVLYLIYTLLSVKLDTELMAILENGQVGYLVIGVNLFILINIILDNFTSKRLFYYHSTLTHTKILLGKLGTVLIYTSLTIIVAVSMYNSRLYILSRTDFLKFFRMNLDSAGFSLIGKSIRECFYPLNYLLNLLFIDILIYTMAILFHHLKKKANVGLSLIISVFSIAIPNILIFSALDKIKWGNALDLNLVNHHIHVMVLRNNEINFLNLIFVIIYAVMSIYLINRICRYQKGNRL